jgi:hypothetical protein
MIVSSQIIVEAKKQAKSGPRIKQYVESPGGSIRADEVVDLLATSTSPAAQRGARQLLRDMAESPWCVMAAPHSNSKDPTWHITIDVDGTGYHLRLDARGCISDITHVTKEGTQRISGNRPWAGPGSV